MTPDRIEFHIGETVYKQPLRLVYSKDSGGRMVWTIYRDAESQRDDPVFIGGLTDEIIIKMAEAVQSK